MPVDRPTFSESWYRVAPLHPRLVSTAQVFRQQFRGQDWHVVRDPVSNQFYRLNDAAYRFVGLLDGRRSVADAWRLCNDQLGDQAPTQGEAITLLGQLYASNLLQAELPPDAEGLFRRYRKRRTREVQGFLMNLLFVRIPLLDPDRFLNAWVSLFGKLFTVWGLFAWLILLGLGGYFLAGRGSDLMAPAAGVLDPANLPLMYVALVLTKVLHEFGHAFACKQLARGEGGGGEVHVMGVMFLVFAPMPYMDASSSWAFRDKWRRAVVAAAGMMTELGIAALAVIVWTQTAPGAVHAIAWNVIFIAGFSTIVFNANPLLRYDGYYILSDLLEIPNLAQRSKEHLYYLVRRYVWSIRGIISPAHSPGEAVWMAIYAVASTIYRVVVCIAILLFVIDKLFVVGTVLAAAAFIAWVVVPLVKFVKYVVTGGELARTRGRALITTGLTFAAIIVAFGIVPMPDRDRLEGIVEPIDIAVIHAAADGFIDSALPSNRFVDANTETLLSAHNLRLEAQLDQDLAQKRELAVRYRLALTQEPAAAQAVTSQIDALQDEIARVDRQLASLKPASPISGEWNCPQWEDLPGAYVHRGDPLGLVFDPRRLMVRAAAGQDTAARLVAEGRASVEIRLKGRPDWQWPGTVLETLPAGTQHLPSAALGYAVGGTMQTVPEDTHGTKVAGHIFEIQIAVDPNAQGYSPPALLPGQRVVIRFRLPDRPLLLQAWRAALQVVQRRFNK